MSAELTGQSACVTGAGRGIGRAVASALAAAGAELVLVARSAGELEETRSQVAVHGRQVYAVPADVAQRQEVRRAVAAALERLGKIDVLVNCAGRQPPIGPLWENEPDDWVRTIEVNLIGTFHCIQAIVPGMIARRHGKIINFSGGGATGPRPNFSGYGASKAAIVRLTETLAEELKGFNVQVNAVAPGAINTRMLDEVLAAGSAAGPELAAAEKRKSQGGTPIELAARLVVFLASGASGALTGKLLSAPHDGWETWDAAHIARLADSPWYTLRRMDEHTLRPFLEKAV